MSVCVDIPYLEGKAASVRLWPKRPEYHAGFTVQKVGELPHATNAVEHTDLPTVGTSSHLVAPRLDLSDPGTWTLGDKKRFHNLATKEALGTLSETEEVELERLAEKRRVKLSPRRGEDVIMEFKRSERHAALMAAIKSYVSVFGSPS